MKKKDLAEEYLDKVCFEKAYLKKLSIPIMSHDKVFDRIDIKAAFNAGRESVFKNIPELEWINYEDVERFISECAFGQYYIYKEDGRFLCYLASNKIGGYYTSCEEAKQSANEDYKKRIKQALGYDK